jgi:glycosyltransferase involved in cell wall biosynthesis
LHSIERSFTREILVPTNNRNAVVNNSTIAPSEAGSELPIIVHSHLRWDFVWQRPQQILARLASRHRIAFIEEPLWDTGNFELAISEPTPNIVRIVPRLGRAPGLDTDAQCHAILEPLQRALAEHPLLAGRFGRVIHWFYSPMVAPVFLGQFNAAAVVYDCMDELAKFRGAQADLPERESVLLAAADVVFTGGYQLFKRKSRLHGNVHFYGCGVDVEHYAKASQADTAIPADIASLPSPVLGYFGVIDERLDYGLIDTLARTFATGSVVMIGPFAKIDPDSLPRHSNLHWLGQRSYAELPAYVKAFDVCLMPFALNEATENINPTKTLEYMAAGKPIVSTAVADVVRNFTPIVEVAASNAEFVALAQRLAESPDRMLIERGIERARAATWDAIVHAMHAHVLAAVAGKQRSSPQLVSA